MLSNLNGSITNAMLTTAIYAIYWHHIGIISIWKLVDSRPMLDFSSYNYGFKCLELAGKIRFQLVIRSVGEVLR